MSDVVAENQRKIFADNLRQLMDIRGITQDDIVRKLGYSSSTVSDWYNAKKYPRVKKMQELADLFGVTLSDLRDNHSFSTPSNIIPIPRTIKIPLLGTIACGEPLLAEENIEDEVDLPEHIRADFALRCKGDSMINARIFDGDIVYICKRSDVANGKIAAVRVGDEATLKRVYYFPDDARLVLRPCNPMYSDMIYTGPELEDIEIIGEAVAFTSLVRHE